MIQRERESVVDSVVDGERGCGLHHFLSARCHQLVVVKLVNACETIPQPSEWEQIVVFEPPDLLHRSPNSGKLLHKSRELKKEL